MDLSQSLQRSEAYPASDEAASGFPALLAAAAARGAATPTAFAQARLPVHIDPIDAAFDVAAAATLLVQRRSGRDRRVNAMFTEPL